MCWDFFREIYILLHYVIYMNVYNVCNNGNSTVCIMCTLLSLSCKYMHTISIHTISIHTQTYLPLVFKGVWSPAPQPALGGLSCSSEHHSTRGASRTLCPNKMGRLQWCFTGDPSSCRTVGLTAPGISYCIGKSCQKVTSKQSQGTIWCLSLQWTKN